MIYLFVACYLVLVASVWALCAAAGDADDAAERAHARMDPEEYERRVVASLLKAKR